MSYKLNKTELLKYILACMEPAILGKFPDEDEFKRHYAVASIQKNAVIKAYFDFVEGFRLFYKAEYHRGLALFRKIEEQSPADDRMKALNAYALARTYYMSGDLKLGLQYSYHSLDRFNRLNDYTWVVQVESLLAGQLNSLGFYEDALRLLLNSADYYKKNELWLRYVINRIDVGNVYKRMQLYKKAEQYYMEAEKYLKLYISPDSINPYHNLYKHFGDLYLYTGDFGKAHAWFDKIEKDGMDKVHPFLGAMYYLSRGEAFKFQKKYKQAMEQVEKSLESGQKNGFGKIILAATRSKGEILAGMKKYRAADVELQKALKLSQRDSSLAMEMEIYQELFLLNKQHAHLKKAQFYIEKYLKRKEELNSKENQLRAAAIEALNELKVKREELQRAEQQNALQKQELQMATLFLNQKTSLIDELEQFVANLKRDNSQKQKVFKAIHEKLKSARLSSSENDAFKEKLNASNQQFVLNIRQKFNTISKTEAQVAALLRNGMNSKEIADLLVIDARSVEMHRYRLRKKMKLGRKDDLMMELNKY